MYVCVSSESRINAMQVFVFIFKKGKKNRRGKSSACAYVGENRCIWAELISIENMGGTLSPWVTDQWDSVYYQACVIKREVSAIQLP